MYKNLRITAVIPCLNEEIGISEVLREVPPFVDEVIVVDNGSTDRTAVIARDMGAHVISELHRGYGKAYKSGFSRATGDIIVTLDGDHSYPVDALSYLLEAFMHCRVGFLSASRFPMLNDAAMTPKQIDKLIEQLGLLVVDENPYTRKITRMMLMNIGAKLIYSPDNGRTWHNQDGSTPVVWEDWYDRSRKNMLFFREPQDAFSFLTFVQMG